MSSGTLSWTTSSLTTRLHGHAGPTFLPSGATASRQCSFRKHIHCIASDRRDHYRAKPSVETRARKKARGGARWLGPVWALEPEPRCKGLDPLPSSGTLLLLLYEYSSSSVSSLLNGSSSERARLLSCGCVLAMHGLSKSGVRRSVGPAPSCGCCGADDGRHTHPHRPPTPRRPLPATPASPSAHLTSSPRSALLTDDRDLAAGTSASNPSGGNLPCVGAAACLATCWLTSPLASVCYALTLTALSAAEASAPALETA